MTPHDSFACIVQSADHYIVRVQTCSDRRTNYPKVLPQESQQKKVSAPVPKACDPAVLLATQSRQYNDLTFLVLALKSSLQLQHISLKS